MKYGLIISSLLFLFGLQTGQAQSTMPYRYEVETGVGVLQLPSPYQPGWLAHQQLTAYVSPRAGVALGLHWGASANRSPLNATVATGSPDPVQLRDFYQRNETMTNLSLVALPVLTNRHRLALRAGLSAYKRRELGIDSIVYLDPRSSYFEEIPRIINTTRLVPTAAVSYDFRLSNRWAAGASATGWFTGDGRPTTSLAVRGAYRFGLPADSLGIRSVDWNTVRYGLRAAAMAVTSNSRSSAEVYRLRFTGGLWAELPLSLTWSVRGEVNYAQRGYRITANAPYQPATGNLNYLELPLLFRHEVAYRWHLYGGPYLAFLLGGYTETDGKRSAPKAHTNSGLMIGTSYSLTNRLGIDLRYQRDLIQLSSTPYGGQHSAQIGLTYAFGKNL